MNSATFEQMESDVKVYSRSFPAVFNSAKDAMIEDENGNRYIDFLAGAGSLNYGHNNDQLKGALLEYIGNDGITHGLDMYTQAKREFLEALKNNILRPRAMDHLVQFTGPTGTNAVEAALKIARKVTGRENIVAFTNGFHGVSYGALAATGNQHHRGGAGIALGGVTRIPYYNYAEDIDGLDLLSAYLKDPSSGLDKPAAVIVEIVQGEGGLNTASKSWVQRLATLCKENDILLIVDDIQAGCGRTGRFFSFDEMGIEPDLITLSKSLSGYGLPFSIVLLKPELDVWKPGEHNGTFRGNNHAFVTAAKALNSYWHDDNFAKSVRAKGQIITDAFDDIVVENTKICEKRKGRGMMQGVEVISGDVADEICKYAFGKGLIVETSGPHGEVVKCLAPLTIDTKTLKQGLEILKEAFTKVEAAQ